MLWQEDLVPVSRKTAESLARNTAELYVEAERIMLERIARNLAKGIDAPLWAERKLASLQAYEAQTRHLIRDLQMQARTGVETALTQAYDRGGLAAVADLKPILGKGNEPVQPLPGIKAVESIAAETMGKLDATGQRILVTTRALYRESVSAGTNQVLLGTQTRLQATQTVLDDFAKKGITGFIDAAGRAWNLTSYAEMAVRAGTMNAAVAGHMDTLVANDLDLVIVSADGSPCPDCQPWEGEVLSISGDSDEYPALEEAEAAGLLHPGCLHDYSAYQEGITQPYPEKSEADLEAEAQRYKDNQQQRLIERNIRESKRMEAVALDPAAAQKAADRVAYYQAQAREHVANTSAVRQYAREQVGKAH
ncbi:MAG: phage minor capsid protein [Phycisphaerales bacterium]